uniref:(northern house mosquito) hypothetical protein n=1 Tax=Culex pipiens TaxID=7175 RepID=A0A8D8ADV5_CULPI
MCVCCSLLLVLRFINFIIISNFFSLGWVLGWGRWTLEQVSKFIKIIFTVTWGGRKACFEKLLLKNIHHLTTKKGRKWGGRINKIRCFKRGSTKGGSGGA